MTLVTCESVAAIIVHLRDEAVAPIRLSGHSFPRPRALCDAEIAWDTKLPVDAASCGTCIEIARSTGC